MSQIDTKIIYKAILFVLCVALFILLGCHILETKKFKGMVEDIERNNADYLLEKHQNVGSYTSIDGDILYFDDQFVVLSRKNVFSRSDDLTLKEFVIEPTWVIGFNNMPVVAVCAKNHCRYIDRTNIDL